MKGIPVNKEVRGKNKIALGMDVRQLLCVAVCGFVLLICYFNLKDILSMEYMMFITIILSIITYVAGWYTRSGLYIETLVFIKLKNRNIENQKRRYKTKNQYIKIMNMFYMKKRIDLKANKTEYKAYLKQEKIRAKKKSQMRAIM